LDVRNNEQFLHENKSNGSGERDSIVLPSPDIPNKTNLKFGEIVYFSHVALLKLNTYLQD
jgi:hypothetical protein